MERTHSCCKWRTELIEKQICAERVADRPVTSRFANPSSTCVAHNQVPALTRYLRVLTFSSTTKNEYFCLWEWGRKRLRLARARILARYGAGTLEGLEMAA